MANDDVVAAQNGLERYKDMDYSFSTSRECQFLEKVCAAIEASNIDDFADELYNFDNVSKLEPWRTTLLLRTRHIVEKGDAGEEDLS